jgi:hypothetical protein
MYWQLALTLQIRLGRPLKRYRPETLLLPRAINVSGLVWSGLVWSGLVWSGLVWSGLVWSGLVWSIDFMLDRRADAQEFRTLYLIDDYNRVAMGGLEVGFSMPAPRVIR